jgi:hypothetical protein
MNGRRNAGSSRSTRACPTSTVNVMLPMATIRSSPARRPEKSPTLTISIFDRHFCCTLIPKPSTRGSSVTTEIMTPFRAAARFAAFEYSNEYLNSEFACSAGGRSRPTYKRPLSPFSRNRVSCGLNKCGGRPIVGREFVQQLLRRWRAFLGQVFVQAQDPPRAFVITGASSESRSTLFVGFTHRDELYGDLTSGSSSHREREPP